MDPGGGDDAGGLEDAFGEDQAGIMQYLEEVIGEDFDQSFLEEFRNSELFADVMREYAGGAPPGSSNQSTASRRPSINVSDIGVRDGNLNQLDPLRDNVRPEARSPAVTSTTTTVVLDQPVLTESMEPESPPQSSSRKSSPTKRNRKQRTEELKITIPTPTNSTSSDDSFEESWSQSQKKVKDKLKIRPLTSATPPASSSSRKDKKWKSPPEKQKKAYVAGPKSKNKSASPQQQILPGAKQLSSPYEKQKPKLQVSSRSLFSSSHTETSKLFQEAPRKSSSQTKSHLRHKSKNGSVHMLDLVHGFLKNGVDNTHYITPRLLEEIRLCEMKARLACPSCKNLPPLSTTTSTEEERSNRGNSGALEMSRSEETRTPSHVDIQGRTKSYSSPVTYPEKVKTATKPSYRDVVKEKDHAMKPPKIETIMKEKEDNKKVKKLQKSSSPDKMVNKTSLDKMTVKITTPEKSPGTISSPEKRPTPREKSTAKKDQTPTKITQRENSPIKTTSRESSPIKTTRENSPIKTTRENSPIKTTRENSPIKTTRENSPIKTTSRENSAVEKFSPENTVEKTIALEIPFKIASQEKSPTKISPREKSPTRISPQEKSPIRIVSLENSPVKAPAPEKTVATPPEKSPIKVAPTESMTENSSPVVDKAKKKSPMSFDKLAILHESLNKAKCKKEQVPSRPSDKVKPVSSKPQMDVIEAEGKDDTVIIDLDKTLPIPFSENRVQTNKQDLPTGDEKELIQTSTPPKDITETNSPLLEKENDVDLENSLLIPINQIRPKSTLSSSADEINANRTLTEENINEKTFPENLAAEITTTLEPAVIDVVQMTGCCNNSPESSQKVTAVEKTSPVDASSPEQVKHKKSVDESKEIEMNVLKKSVPSTINDAQMDKDTKESKGTEEKKALIIEKPSDDTQVRAPQSKDATDQGTNEKIASPCPETVDIMDSGPPSPEVVDFTSPPPSPAADDSGEPSSPEISRARKSPTPDKMTSNKKKNVIESSSDDGDHRREDADLTDDTTPERKKSSDDDELSGNKKEVRFVHNPSIERKRDQEDCRSGKFGEFEMERQRKKDKRKGGRDKSGKGDPFEDFMRDKQLSGSFRIPKKGLSTNRKTDNRSVVTPLTTIDVPKEKMQFEKFRKGLSDKEKIERKERGEWNNRNRGGGGDFNNEFRGGGGGADQKFSGNRFNREPSAFDRHKLRDDARVVLLAPEEGKKDDGDNSTPAAGEVIEGDQPEPEPTWADDGEEPGGGDSPIHHRDDDEVKDGDTAEADKMMKDVPETKKDDKNESDSKTNIKQETVLLSDIKKEVVDDAADDILNPEVPLKHVEVNAFSVGAMMLLQENPNPPLPDVEEENNLAEATMMKVAWWISKGDFENSVDVSSREDWYKIADCLDSDDDGAQSDSSFHELLKFTQAEEDEIYNSLDRDQRKKKSNGPLDEHCGRQLLVSQYRSGPGDKFTRIFQVRGTGPPETAYAKDNFQARCTLCDVLVVGKAKLTNHVLSESHREKMSKAGLDRIKPAEAIPTEKIPEKAKDDKKPESVDKNGDIKKGTGEDSKSPDKKDRKRDDERKDREKKIDEDKQKDKKRKRSKDKSSPEKSRHDSGAEVGVTSTGLAIKIPAGAIPDKDKKRGAESRDKRSRSRSPRHKRNRSRSPRHHSGRDRSPRRRSRSRSRSPLGSSSRRRRSRSKSRDRGRDRAREPVVRISRSPGKIRRRSTSAERVEKFLAKTQRRSRSPSNGYRKRHRPTSPSPTSGLLPKKTNKEFHEKMALTLEGKWTEELEGKWKMMEAEEAIFMEQFGEKSKSLKTTPESHPAYGGEWTAFWERRYQEIEEEGKEDPDKHNYVPEWKEYWTNKLRELLDKEYEEAIKGIKMRNGVDIDTLQKLRNITIEPLVTATVQLVQLPTPIPQPVPPPTCLPIGIPPPHIHMQQVPSITGTITPSSKSVSEVGEDMTARSMSISDGGDDHPRSRTNVAPPAQSPSTVTTVDIMSTWEKLKAGGIPANKPTTGVPAAPVQLPFRSLSVTRSVDERSIADSLASIDSFGFSTGMDVVQVLYHMSKLEDQLSFFADKVQEYFKKAEAMDLKKRNTSYILLTDEDFVAMLFQIRDRFMAMIRVQILPKDVLDKLNLTVYGLDGILEHPDCQKRRPKVVEPPEVPPPKNEAPQSVPVQPPSAPVSQSPPINVNDTFTRPSTSTSKVYTNNNGKLRNLPEKKKNEIALLLTSFVMSMGREDLTDVELRELLSKMVQPPKLAPPSANNTPRNSASNTPVLPARGGNQNNASDSDSSARSTRFRESPNLDPWRLPERNVTRIFSVASVQGAGTAVPELPNVIPHFHNPSGGGAPLRFGSSSGEESGGGGWGRGRIIPSNDPDNYMSSTSGSGNGRHSPFSRRDFTGNPISANPYRDKVSSTQASSSTTTNKHLTLRTKDAKGPVVTIGTSDLVLGAKGRLYEIKKEPEIQMKQLTKNRLVGQNVHNMKIDPGGRRRLTVEDELAFHIRREEEAVRVSTRSSVGGRTSRRESWNNENAQESDKPKLPPGIMNMIMKERDERIKQQAMEFGEILSEPYIYTRPKKKKKRRKRRAKEEASSSRSSSHENSDGSKYARDRSKERKRRREKRQRKSEKGSQRTSSESPPCSNRRERRRMSPSINKRESRVERERSSSCESSKWRTTTRTRRRSPSRSYERRKSVSDESISPSRENKRGSRRRDGRRRRSYSSTPVESHKRSKSIHRRHSSGEIHSDSNSSNITAEHIHIRKAPTRNDAEKEIQWDENRQRPSRIKSETALEEERVKVTRRAPPRQDSHLSRISDDEMLEYASQPLRSTSYLRDSNLRSKRTLVRSSYSNMNLPSPAASSTSGSSTAGYRRRKERPAVTTVSMPDICKYRLQVEKWESSISEISSMGDGTKDKIPKNEVKDSAQEKIADRNAAENAKVTSVSKTFWLTNDEDAKSLSSISSHEVFPSQMPSNAAPSTIPVPTTVEVTAAVAVAAPSPSKIVRHYRLSLEELKEPGEISTSSDEIGEI